MVIVTFGRAIPKCILVRTLLGSFLRFGLGCIFGRCEVCVRGAISPPPHRVCIIVIIVVFVVIILLVVLVIGVRGVHGLIGMSCHASSWGVFHGCVGGHGVSYVNVVVV